MVAECLVGLKYLSGQYINKIVNYFKHGDGF